MDYQEPPAVCRPSKPEYADCVFIPHAESPPPGSSMELRPGSTWEIPDWMTCFDLHDGTGAILCYGVPPRREEMPHAD